MYSVVSCISVFPNVANIAMPPVPARCSINAYWIEMNVIVKNHIVFSFYA